MIGIDRDPALVGAFNERAVAEGLPAQAVVGDVRTLALRRAFALVIAPMQLIELLGDATERLDALHRVAGHLASGGTRRLRHRRATGPRVAGTERWSAPRRCPTCARSTTGFSPRGR